MPVYRYEHTCGMKQDLFLREDVNRKIVNCERCGRQVSARQVRDKSLTTGEKDGVIGVLQNANPK